MFVIIGSADALPILRARCPRWEREREREKRKRRHHCTCYAKICIEFPTFFAKNSHNWRWVYTFPSQKFALFLHTSGLSLLKWSPLWCWNSQLTHIFRCQNGRPFSSDLSNDASRAMSDRKPKTKDQILPSPTSLEALCMRKSASQCGYISWLPCIAALADCHDIVLIDCALKNASVDAKNTKDEFRMLRLPWETHRKVWHTMDVWTAIREGCIWSFQVGKHAKWKTAIFVHVVRSLKGSYSFHSKKWIKLIPKTIGNRKEIAREVARGDKPYLRKSTDRKAQVSPLNWTNAFLTCALRFLDFLR